MLRWGKLQSWWWSSLDLSQWATPTHVIFIKLWCIIITWTVTVCQFQLRAVVFSVCCPFRSSGDAGSPSAKWRLVRAGVMPALLCWAADLHFTEPGSGRTVYHLVACCPLCFFQSGACSTALSWSLYKQIWVIPEAQESFYTICAVNSLCLHSLLGTVTSEKMSETWSVRLKTSTLIDKVLWTEWSCSITNRKTLKIVDSSRMWMSAKHSPGQRWAVSERLTGRNKERVYKSLQILFLCKKIFTFV